MAGAVYTSWKRALEFTSRHRARTEGLRPASLSNLSTDGMAIEYRTNDLKLQKRSCAHYGLIILTNQTRTLTPMVEITPAIDA